MVNCTCPFVVCDVFTRVLLFEIIICNGISINTSFYTAVLHLSHYVDYRPQEVYYTLLYAHIKILANGHFNCK